MAHIHTAACVDHLSPIKNKRVISYPLNEQDIISLHQTFLTYGFHHMTVKNIASGRLIIRSLLSSLSIYQDIAAVTIDKEPLEANVFNISQTLGNTYFSSDHDNEHHNALILDYFNFDFIWIEATDNLLEKSWYAHFERKIKIIGISQHMPIVYVSYLE